MSVSLQEQLLSLGLSLSMGVALGLFYDLLRRIRLSLPRRALQETLDLLFWLGACGVLFFCGMTAGGGRCGCTSPSACCWGPAF